MKANLLDLAPSVGCCSRILPNLCPSREAGQLVDYRRNRNDPLVGDIGQREVVLVNVDGVGVSGRLIIQRYCPCFDKPLRRVVESDALWSLSGLFDALIELRDDRVVHIHPIQWPLGRRD
jgi:hypothetical protein